jgi:hypothetical protein
MHTAKLSPNQKIRIKTIFNHFRNRHARYSSVNFGSEEYACKVAENVEEAKALIESGYEYVTEVDGVKLFRKRK